MILPAERNVTFRRAAMAKARQSRRPSRLGTPAGAAPEPDRVLDHDAGFPGLLAQVWQQATAAADLAAAVNTLLTLGGRVPADVQLRALRPAEECALKVLCGISWRPGGECRRPSQQEEGPPAFLGSIGLTTSGRIAVGVPSQGPLAKQEDLVDGVIRVPWSPRALAAYQEEVGRANSELVCSTTDCRQWLAAAGTHGRDELLGQLREAALRTAPFVLYQEGKRYTNFRERNNLAGKTLWPGHPDCALSSLQGVPLELWSDSDAVMVVCLTLLIRSGGFARIEEANGTQLTVGHVAELLERTRRMYKQVSAGPDIAPAASTRVEDLSALAEAVRERRAEVAQHVQLYREIYGPLMHKIERVAGLREKAARRVEDALCADLRRRLPAAGGTLDELAQAIAGAPGWLAQPHGEYGTGLESLVYETVSAARTAFAADFAMSRGMRALTRLVQALRRQDWAEITKWDLPDFFCCVAAAPGARRYFGDTPGQLADIAWAISARMQYNSWHFIAGNLPQVPEVAARDYFIPPTIPDIAYYSDQHHHGHVAARVRFSIRSPQAVEILGRSFRGFIDLRLLRCDGQPFAEQDLLAAHRTSAFIARATRCAAALAAAGENVEVTSFDSRWHWHHVAAPPRPAADAVTPQAARDDAAATGTAQRSVS
jgi:hypothetical protein